MFFRPLTFRLLILIITLFQSGFSMECLDLEPGDMSGYDITKYVGTYEVAMGILGDGAYSKAPFNCNKMTFLQHTHHSNGTGLHAVISVYGNDKETAMDIVHGQMNSTTDIYAIETDGYHPAVENKWTDLTIKFLLTTEDLFVYSACFKNGDDNNNDVEFVVAIFRKEGSTLPISQIQALLPESIKNNPGLKTLCDS